jgi:hypothetical protein
MDANPQQPHKTFLRNVKPTTLNPFYPQNLPLGDGASSTVLTDLYPVETVGTTNGMDANPQQPHKTFLRNVKPTTLNPFYPQNLPRGDGAFR